VFIVVFYLSRSDSSDDDEQDKDEEGRSGGLQTLFQHKLKALVVAATIVLLAAG
jgi:hypothetical protein